jgi:hypothetical protein
MRQEVILPVMIKYFKRHNPDLRGRLLHVSGLFSYTYLDVLMEATGFAHDPLYRPLQTGLGTLADNMGGSLPVTQFINSAEVEFKWDPGEIWKVTGVCPAVRPALGMRKTFREALDALPPQLSRYIETGYNLPSLIF